MNLKKLVPLFAAAAMVVALAGCSAPASNTSSNTGNAAAPAASSSDLRFMTGGESGTYYAFGSVIAQHATNNGGVAVKALVGNGSKANIEALQDHDAELALCQSDVMAYAYQGTNLFTSKIDTFTTVAALYDETVQIVTTNADIKTVADLKGKRVSIGAMGSGVYFNAIDILKAYDLTEKDITPTYQSFADSADALKNGQIDAAFIVAGAPTTAIVDLSTSKQAYLVALDDAHVDKLLAASPYYSKNVIKAGTYKGIDTDTTTVAVQAVILADKNVSEDAIYKLTKDIFDNYASLTSSHAKYGELSMEKATSITTVPYHKGAAKYFAEKNITVPAA